MVSVKLLVEGGNMKPSPTIAQQLGPMGINISKVISDINEKTKGFNGMNVPVILDVDAKTKNYTITVKSPPTSELLKKEAGITIGSGARLKTTVGDIPFEKIISVAIQKNENMLSNTLLDSVKSVLGTCQAMGIIVDNQEIKDVMVALSSGYYDAMIKAKKVDVDEERKKELKQYLDNVVKKQTADKAAADAVAQTTADAKASAKSGSASAANKAANAPKAPAKEPAKPAGKKK